MHITRYTDYSLRVLMYLAVKGEELSTIKEIADSYQISKNHLMKIVQQLNNKEYSPPSLEHLIKRFVQSSGVEIMTDIQFRA